MSAHVIGRLLKPLVKLLGSRSLPVTSGMLTIGGLGAPVEIIRDTWGIPHIYAKNDQDLFRALGFVHAQDRFWQMEMYRRIGSGTLAEVLGKEGLAVDRAIRTFGLNRLARRDLDACDAATRAILDAYAGGVNAWLSQPSTRLPVEFTLLGHTPAPWAALDSVAIVEFIVWDLLGSWAQEPVLANIAARVGPDAMKEFDPDFSMNPGSIVDGFEVNLRGIDGKLAAMKLPYRRHGTGSNAWAISGQRTASGKPIHMGDPHLTPATPAVWYAVHLIGGGFNVTGASIAGMPFVPIGHNARCSWSCCMSMVDGVDLYMEKLDLANPRRYLYKNEWIDAAIIEEPITIKGKREPFIERVVVTRHGPVISGIEGLGLRGPAGAGSTPVALAYCSVARDPCNLMRGGIALALMGSWDDFLAAGQDLDMLFMHVTYADIDGNVGSHVCSRVPLRKKGHDGRMPVPGWTGELDWDDGYLPFDQLPHCLNPAKGFVVAANNKPFDGDGYPHYLGSTWDPGFRARRITEVIGSMDKASVEELKALNLDVVTAAGKDFVERLRQFETTDPDAAAALQLLRSWNGEASVGSAGAAACELAMHFTFERLLEASLDDKMLVDGGMGLGFHPILRELHEFAYSVPLILFRMLDTPGSAWCKKAGGRQAVIEHGLAQATRYLERKLGKDPKNWAWGRINTITFPHAFASQKPMDVVFNPPSRPMGGTATTVCVSWSPPGTRWHDKNTASTFRFAIDWADPSRAGCILPPGQSGHLASPHYADMLDPWLKGEYIPMLWTREQVEASAEAKLVLAP